MMEYIIIKQKRKTASIAIDKDLRVVVKVPKYMSQTAIKKLVAEHETWIETTLKKKKVLYETQDFIKTGRLLYLGNYWPVTFENGNNQQGKVVFNETSGFKIQTTGDEKQIRGLVELFFKERAKIYLKELSDEYAARLGVQYHKITIRKQATRWGSCSRQGNLSYNLKILCAPTDMIAYVVLHEVMHLRHFNHSQAFWKAMEEEMPDYKRRMNYFKQFGQNFMI